MPECASDDAALDQPVHHEAAEARGTVLGALESRMSGRIRTVQQSLTRLDADLAAGVLTDEEHAVVSRLLLATLGPRAAQARRPQDAAGAAPVLTIPQQRSAPQSRDGAAAAGTDPIQISTWESRRPRELLGFLAREYLRGRLQRERYVALRRAVAVVATLSGQQAVLPGLDAPGRPDRGDAPAL